LTEPPVGESLLLGAPELLLPLPFRDAPIGEAVETDASPAEPVDPGELEILIQQLESARAPSADWAIQASTLLPLANGRQSKETEASDMGHQTESGSDVADLRRAARAIVEGTARRLELGLLLAWQGGAAVRQPRFVECWVGVGLG